MELITTLERIKNYNPWKRGEIESYQPPRRCYKIIDIGVLKIKKTKVKYLKFMIRLYLNLRKMKFWLKLRKKNEFFI